jgi:vacuolar-type H+-ATPase subunit E/Vma4
MSTDHIRKAILAEAQAEAKRVETEARRRHDERLAAARQALDAEFSMRREEARQKVEQAGHREVSQRRAQHNLDLLQRRNAILDDLFRRAGERLLELPDDEYRAVVESWVAELPADVAGEVLCNARDEKRLAPLVEKLNGRRPAAARLKLAPHAGEPLLGGVICRTEKFQIDMSLDARLRRLREELAPEVAKIVFTGQVTV